MAFGVSSVYLDISILSTWGQPIYVCLEEGDSITEGQKGSAPLLISTKFQQIG